MSRRPRQDRRPNRVATLGSSLLVAACLGASAGPAMAAHSLATPITAELRQPLWPVEVGVEIVAVGPPLGTEGVPLATPLMPVRAVTIPDGHRVTFSRAVWTPRGRRAFTVDVVAHQHPRDEMEIEWDLVVEDAPYETVSVGAYLLHRLRFGPRPGVGPELIRVSRADIVTTRGRPHLETVEIDGQTYEVRVFATSVRG